MERLKKTLPKGVIYICCGERLFQDEAIYLAKTLRHHNGAIDISVFTDDPSLQDDVFNQILLFDTEDHPYRQKVSYLRRSPYRKTLFLDTDTRITGSVEPLFKMLEKTHFAIAKAPHVKHRKNPPVFLDFKHPTDYNSGVFLFDESEVAQSLIRDWFSLVSKEDLSNTRKSDQESLNRLLIREGYDKELCLLEFDNEIYNVRPWMYDNMSQEQKEKIVILHIHGLHADNGDRTQP